MKDKASKETIYWLQRELELTEDLKKRRWILAGKYFRSSFDHEFIVCPVSARCCLPCIFPVSYCGVYLVSDGVCLVSDGACCLPNVRTIMSAQCLQNVCQMSTKCLLNVCQISTKCLFYVCKMSVQCSGVIGDCGIGVPPL